MGKLSTGAQTRLSAPETYLSYVSPLLLRNAAAAFEPPHVETISGTVALIDVEQFSAFAERMSLRGSDGIEQLSIRINDTFAVVVDAIERYGGVAHSFPGDSVIALWPSDSRGPQDSALLASRCALELVERHRGSELPLKAGLAAGDVRLAHVGGIDGRMHLLLSGAPLDSMGRAEERASRGRVIAAGEAWRLISEHATGFADADGYYEVQGLHSTAPVVTADPAFAFEDSAPLLDSACAYMPSALLRQLDAGHSAWLGEFRELATMFIQIGSGSAGVAIDSIDGAHRAFCEIQRMIYRHGGDITRFAHDDKGLAVLSVFGLPPASSEDMARRAVLAALEIVRRAPEHDFRCRIGIATGRVFCGTLGAPRRREFSVVGSTANLAARLMQTVDSGVLCDAATKLAAGSVCRFDSAGRLKPKGFPDEIEIFRAEMSDPQTPAVVHSHAKRLVGRERESERLNDWIDGLRDRSGALALLEGEAGVGKSALLATAVARARDAGFEVIHAHCDAVQSMSSYGAWARVLSNLLHLAPPDSGEDRAGAVLSALSAAGVQPEFAPLVAPVIGVEIPENATTLGMTGSARGETLLAVLARLLSHLATSRRDAGSIVLVLLEDVHWLDAASWQLLDVVVRSFDTAPLAILATLRSEATPLASEWRAVVSGPSVEQILLGPLTLVETRELILGILDARSLSQQLLQLVHERTRGNPFFCEQLVSALAESGVLVVDAGIASLRFRSPEQAETLVPRSVAAVVTSRLDRLPAPVQLTLKTASVIGRHFALTVLAAIHPMHPDEDTLGAHLRSAIELGLIEKEDSASGAHAFRHAITSDVAYEMLLTSQRRQLHREIAEYLTHDAASPEARASLFHHWRRSGDQRRALQYVDEAGAQAMRNGSYHAVSELYGYALETLAAVPDAAPAVAPSGEPPREAKWSGHLGEAQVALGLHDAARTNLELCLATLDESAPRATPMLVAGIARESFRQLVHRLLPSRTQAARASEAPRLALAANTYEQLGYVYYASGETTKGLFAALRILNLAELAGLPDLMARSYAVMSLTASVIGLPALAEMYDARAMALAREMRETLAEAYVGWITGLRAAGDARWDLVASRVEPACRIAGNVGDRRLQLMSLQTMSWPAYVEGNVARLMELAAIQLDIARESNNRLWEAWGLNSQSEACMMAGDHQAIVRNSERALDVLQHESDRAEEIRSLGLLAFSLYRLERSDEALAAACRGLDLMSTIDMTNVSTYEGFAGVCETFTGVLEDALRRDGRVATTLRQDAHRAVAAMTRFSRTFPIGLPRVHSLRARLALADGRTAAALKQFRRAQRLADDYRMPHEKGLALLASARSEAFGPDERTRCAEEAARIVKGGDALKEARALVEWSAG